MHQRPVQPSVKSASPSSSGGPLERAPGAMGRGAGLCPFGALQGQAATPCPAATSQTGTSRHCPAQAGVLKPLPMWSPRPSSIRLPLCGQGSPLAAAPMGSARLQQQDKTQLFTPEISHPAPQESPAAPSLSPGQLTPARGALAAAPDGAVQTQGLEPRLSAPGPLRVSKPGPDHCNVQSCSLSQLTQPGVSSGRAHGPRTLQALPKPATCQRLTASSPGTVRPANSPRRHQASHALAPFPPQPDAREQISRQGALPFAREETPKSRGAFRSHCPSS